jgi:hypothetical protein
MADTIDLTALRIDRFQQGKGIGEYNVVWNSGTTYATCHLGGRETRVSDSYER